MTTRSADDPAQQAAALPPLPDSGERRRALEAWLARLDPQLGIEVASLRSASSDASFRRYFRVDCRGSGAPSLIVMDAPPSHEDCRPYVHVAGLLAARGVNTPPLLGADIAQGFLLLGDLGSTTYADALAQADEPEIGALYADALAALVRLQRAPAGASDAQAGLPAYDRARLLAEMRLFPDWYLARHLGAALEPAEQAALAAAFETLIASAQAQTQVLVHRDYHCRNLMRLAPAPGAAPRFANPGVLDFQDAVIGPISYDLVSLLRDAYVEWPEARQLDWAARYWEAAGAAGLAVPARFDEFWRDFEWMGLQRTLKVLGIFARLCHRDGKTRYLADLPLVLRHTQRVAERYDAFAGLARLLERVHGRTRSAGYTF